MSWPLSHEFNEAIQSPKVAFADPDLRDGEVVVGATGLPLPRSGNFADVYQMRGADGRDWAVKCFTRPVAGLGERYAKVSDALERAGLPFTVGFKFLAEGIRVGGVWRPIVKMEWVEGMLLNQVVREAAGKPPKLGALGQMWAKLCKRLREAGLAHADLQHGNVLLVPGTRAGAYGLKLIDYDGVWVPALANTPSGESGHPSFQHPARAATRAYSPDVDRFPHLVVATALRGLSVAGAPLWEKYDNGDNLLFTEDDYKKPSASKAMLELWHLDDPGVQALVGRLAIACGKPIPQTPWLDQFAPDGEPALLDEATRREAAAALGIALPVPAALPPEPTGPVPAPPPPENPFAVVNADEEPPAEVDVELVEEPARKSKKSKEPATNKSKRHKAHQPKGSGGKGLILAGAGAAVLLLVGVVVAVVVMGGGKPNETVQQKEDPPVVTPRPGPNDPVVVPKPKDNNPVLVPPKKEPDPVPLVPAKWTLAERWKQPLPADWTRTFELRVGPDSRTGQVWCSDGKYRIFDPNTGEALTNPDGRPSIMYGVYVLDDGNVVRPWHTPAGPIQVWNARTGKEVTTLKRPLDGGLRIWLAPNHRCLAVEFNNLNTGKGQTRLVDTSTDKVLLDCDSYFGTVRFTADSSRALIWDGFGQCQWVKLPSGEVEGTWKLADATEPLRMSALSGDGSRVVFTGRNKYGYRLIDGQTGKLVRQLSSFPSESSLSHDGKLIFSSSANKSDAELAVADTGEVLARVPLPPNTEETALGIAPDVSAAFAAVPAGAGKFELIRYDLTRGAAPASPPDPGVVAVKERFKTQLDFTAQDVQFDANGRTILAHAWNRPGLALVDARTGAVQTVNTSGPLRPRNVVPLADGRVGLRVTETQVLAVVSAETGKPLGSVPFTPFTQGTANVPTVIRVSPDERYVAAGLSNPVRLDPETKRPVHFPTAARVLDTRANKTVVDLEWHNAEAAGRIAFAPDASRVLVLESTLRGRWFKLPSGEPDKEWTYAPAGGKADWLHLRDLSHDARVALCEGIVDGGPRVFVLDTATGDRGTTFAKAPGFVSGIGLSRDGRRALILHVRPGAKERDFVIADTATGAEVARVPAPLEPDTDVTGALSPDGRALVLFDRRKVAPLVVYDIPAGTGAGVPEPAGPGATEVRERFKTQLDVLTRDTQFGADGRAVLTYEWNKRELTIVDARTGAARVTNAPSSLHPNNVIPLPGGRAGLCPTGSKEVTVVSTETGKALGTIPLPTFPAGSNPFYGAVAVSPDDRYVAVGLDSTTKQDPDTKKPVTTPGPFQVLDTKTNKVIVAGEWTRTHQGGQIVFSPDSARVLVVDATLRGRWYKLPSGEPDKTWTHAADQTERVRIRDVSRDGRLMLCEGTVEGWHRAYVVDTATGERVATLVKVIGVMTGVGLSADGRRALLSHLKAGGKESDFVIADTATGAEVARVPRPVGPDSDAVGVLAPDGRAIVVTDRRKSAPLVVYDIPAGPGGGAGAAVAAGPPLPPPATPLEMKPKWSVDAKIKSGSAPAFTGDGSRIAIANRGALPWSISTFDARTGATGPELAKLGGNSAHAVITQDGPAVAYQHDHGRAMVVWDTNTDKTVSRAYPQPEGAPRSTPLVTIAPNGKYLTVAHHDSPDQRKEREPTPLLVIDAATGQTVFKTDWKQGHTLFTADGTRLLVVDADDRFRWFQLPDGKPDGEWAFNRPAFGFNAQVFAMSADGRVIAYQGQPPGKEDALHLLDGTSGKVLHSFPAKRYQQAVSVSENGRFVALVRNDGFGPGHTLEVLDAKGNLFAALKFAPKSNTAVAVSWKTRGVALFDRTAGTLTAYELPFDPNGSGSAVAVVQPPAVGGDAVEAPLAGEPPALKARWGNVKVGDGKAFDQLLFAPDASAVLLGSSTGGFEALDPKSGAPRTVGFTGLSAAGVADFFPLGGAHLGTFSPKATEVKVWDGKTGRLVTKHGVPDLAPGSGGATALKALLAPNEKHLVAARSGPPATTYPDVPFKVFDVTGKKEELATDWKGGEVHFTADSTKVLVAEWGGRCRWFKLPSGDAAESWDLGPARAGRPHRVTGASADGAVLGYTGPAAEKARGNGSGVLDGKTGKLVRVFHSDYHANSPVEVSADGKRAALIRDIERFALTLDVVELATGARVGRARVTLPFGPDGPPAGAPPLFALAPDGRALVVYDPVRQKVHLFDVPAASKGP